VFIVVLWVALLALLIGQEGWNSRPQVSPIAALFRLRAAQRRDKLSVGGGHRAHRYRSGSAAVSAAVAGVATSVSLAVGAGVPVRITGTGLGWWQRSQCRKTKPPTAAALLAVR